MNGCRRKPFFSTKSVCNLHMVVVNYHGKMIGCAQTIRDAKGDEDYVRIAVKYLLEALEEHDDIMRRFK